MKPKPAPFPWDEVIGFGFGILRLAPDAFWAMTPREIARAAEAIHGRSRPDAMGRQALDRLLREFPDR